MEVRTRILRKMGYKADSQGLIDRYIRVNGSWEDHLQRTRNFILRSVAGKNIRNLAVLGSGWCLDLPLEELAGTAGNIQLYDLVHPPQVLHRLRRYGNVKAITADVTGGAVERAYQSVRDFRKKGFRTMPEQICSTVFKPAVSPDYLVSLNIYSQLGEMITEYLKLHVPYTKEEIGQIVRLLQQSHLQLLTPGCSCLITDIREHNVDPEGTMAEITELTGYPLPKAKYSETWEWHFDPQGGYRQGKRTMLEVVAMEL